MLWGVVLDLLVWLLLLLCLCYGLMCFVCLVCEFDLLWAVGTSVDFGFVVWLVDFVWDFFVNWLFSWFSLCCFIYAGVWMNLGFGTFVCD